MTAASRGAGALTGQVVHGHPLGDLLGSGGFAEVYRMDVPGSEAVAVKAVRRVHSQPDRTEAEASLLTIAGHPNVVRYLWHEPGTGPLRDHVFIGTELCDHSLEDEFTDLGPGPDRIDRAWKVVPRLANDALAGLTHLHGLDPKVIHRDIKPSNILIAPSGVWRVADFGIARLLGEGEDAALDPTLMFTPAYMPPDPLREHAITPAADLFSLGATVQWAFTGDLVWPALPPPALLRHIGGGGRPTLSPALPDEWVPFVSAALDVRPSRRAAWDYPKLISWTPGNHPDPSTARTRRAAPGPSPRPRPPAPVDPSGATTVVDEPPRPDRDPRLGTTAVLPGGPPQRDTGHRSVDPISPTPPTPRATPAREALTSFAVFVGVLLLVLLIILLTN